MFFSLLVIYVIVPQNDLVTFLSVVIMAIGLIIGVVGDREEVMMMAGLADIISLLAIFSAGILMWVLRDKSDWIISYPN